MSWKTRTFWVAIVIILMSGSAMCQLSARSKQSTKNGLIGGDRLVSSISKLGDPKTSKLFNSLGKLSGFLGAAGGLVSFALVFLPSSESAELRFMRQKFAEVNQKLDRITLELNNIKDLIKFENQRAIYVGSSSKILFGSKKLDEFLRELEVTPCTDMKNCRKVRGRIASRYVNDFDVRQDMFKVLNGAVKSTSEFGDPLLKVIQQTFKCDVGKIDHFTNGVLKLAVGGQMVILAHEKLIGSNFSITQSMDSWLESVYQLRATAYVLKNECNNNIKAYMIADINDKKYQVGVSSNAAANQGVKTFMDEKYKWLGWVAHSYGAYGGSKHCVTNPNGAFWNMPKNQNERKRNLIVSFTDKSGTYSNQKFLVLNAIDDLVAKTNFYSVRGDACNILPKVVQELGKRGVWKYITSLNVLRDYDALSILADNDLTFISEVYDIAYRYKHKKKDKVKYDAIRLVIVLKSIEEANGVHCNLRCLNQGRCTTPPFSSEKYCQCTPYFQGDTCEEHARAELAKTLDAMLETTLTLPTLSDIAFDIQDLRQFVGISFGEVRSAISELEAVFKKAFNDLGRQLSHQFQWSNLITHYSEAIRHIEFYAYRFEELPKRYPNSIEEEGKKLAKAVLAADGVEKWLYELNYLFLGRSGNPLVTHKSLMITFMTRYESQACTATYKAAVDNTWRQLVLLQQMGFMLWAQALEMMSKPTKHSAQLYKSRTTLQVSTLNAAKCQYSIANSLNVQCTGGTYIHPAMNIATHCKTNFYVTGALKSTCVNKASGCNPCNCNAAGSNGLECSDLTGQCSCKPGFYGKMCENRDCVWSTWSAYSACSKACDYGGTRTRTRSHQATKQGRGHACTGPSTESPCCFQRCCSNQFHCSKTQRCIPLNQRCNYDNDCGDKEDEMKCHERCSWKYTPWNDAGGGDMVYLDRHRLSCGGNGHVITEVHLARSGGKIRFEYRCCTLNSIVCTNYYKDNPFTYDGDGDSVYLDRQVVSCGDHGYLNNYGLVRSGDHDHVRYTYLCCYLNHERHRRRTSCYTAYTGFTYDGDGETFYFDRQRVKCNAGYFLTYFHLQRKSDHDHWRHQFRCCKITV